MFKAVVIMCALFVSVDANAQTADQKKALNILATATVLKQGCPTAKINNKTFGLIMTLNDISADDISKTGRYVVYFSDFIAKLMIDLHDRKTTEEGYCSTAYELFGSNGSVVIDMIESPKPN